MGYVTPEQIAKAKEMDLLTYLQRFDPHELVHVGGNTYCTRAHDSLKISNGKWHWFSRGFGGKTALDYLVKVRNVPFTEAVEALAGQNYISVSAPEPPAKTEDPRELLLPPASRCATHAINYLHGRGIDYELIDYCIQTGRLYESQPYHNVVFVGRDAQGQCRYAALRGVAGNFKGEASGSDKRYSFSIAESPGAAHVHLFESAIDLLSYATLMKMRGQDWRQVHLLSLAGVYQTKRENVVPVALDQYLQDHPAIQTIHLHLDNDAIGRGAAAGIQSGLQDRYTVLDQPPPCGKDVNDLLQRRLGLYHQRRESVR